MSWIIKDKISNEVVCETFYKQVADSINTEKYVAIPILEYLGSINTQEKRDSLNGKTKKS